MTRQHTTIGQLARLGLHDPTHAAEALDRWALPAEVSADLVERLGASADPDQVVSGLDRLFDTAPQQTTALISAAPTADRLVALLAGSRSLGHHLAAHPDQLVELEEPPSDAPASTGEPPSWPPSEPTRTPRHRWRPSRPRPIGCAWPTGRP